MNILRNTKIKIFLTVFLVYLFYIAPDYITAGTNRYILLTKSIVDDKTFAIDKYYTMTRDFAQYKGHYYLGAAPGLSLLAAPLYMAFKPLYKLIPEGIYRDMEFNILNASFTLFLALLPGALIAVLLYSILKKFDLKEKERLLLVFASSFGTILFYYSARFMAHVMGAFVVLSAFYILFTAKDAVRSKWLYFVAGLCAGMAVLLEYALMVASILLLCYVFINFRREKILHYASFFAGAGLAAVFFMYYHYKCFGGPFVTAAGYSKMVGKVPFSMPKLNIIYELTFGLYRGLFTYMPVLILSVCGLFVFFGKIRKKYLWEMIFVTLFFLSVFVGISIFSNWAWPWGGDFGNRYFICFIPFLMMPIVFLFGKIKFAFLFWLTALSIFINWCGVQYGDADNAFTDIGLFIFMGLNSNLAEWGYKLTDTYIRKLNVVTHFSPLTGFLLLLTTLCFIWKNELGFIGKRYFSAKNI